MEVTFVSHREAWLDHRVRVGQVSPTSRVDLMRAIMGQAYDFGLVCASIGEHHVEDEPRFSASIIDPATRVEYQIKNVPHDTILMFLRVLKSEGKGGDTWHWEQVRRQMAGECGLN